MNVGKSMQRTLLSERLEMLLPPMPWHQPRYRENEGPCVVLLHGLWRSRHAMEPLARRLYAQGFSVLNVSYPSTRVRVPALAQHVIKTLETYGLNGSQPLHFVTHSLGGIVLRTLLSQQPSFIGGRTVMLAPPNQGSEIVDWSLNKLFLHQFLGPAGRSLASEEVIAAMPPLPPQQETAVIMGKRSSLPWFRNLLETENDGIVSVSRGKIAGMKAFATIEADHTFISIHPDALRLTGQFLSHGTFLFENDEPSSSSPPPSAIDEGEIDRIG